MVFYFKDKASATDRQRDRSIFEEIGKAKNCILNSQKLGTGWKREHFFFQKLRELAGTRKIF